MELHFSTDGNSIFTASTDQTIGIWDIESGTRLKRLKGNSSNKHCALCCSSCIKDEQ